MTTGLLIGFLLYVNNFYNPLRQLASVWSSLQLALAALDRISEVLALESNLEIVPEDSGAVSQAVLEFYDVSFAYPDGQDVLGHVSLRLERGKTYALVGPTGGGKTTTASLMARLYDPTAGVVRLDGRDIRSYPPDERAKKIGFILQEPFLFTGTVRANIVYGNLALKDVSDADLTLLLDKANLSGLLARFDRGLETPVTSSGDSISLGQKQLIAFIRAALRNPELLILDEATANIDTVTEQLLEEILAKLPASTTKVIIAHRLNTIDNADEIFFVNAGTVTRAGSMENAVDMLLHGAMAS
jgi:ATP-binding cassette subfamily B protein